MRISDWSSDVCSSDLQANVSDRRGAAIHESQRYGGEAVDPRRMQVLAEIAEWAQKLAGNQHEVVVEQPVDVGKLKRCGSRTILLCLQLQFALEKYLVVVTVVEDRVEADLRESRITVLRSEEVGEAIATQMRDQTDRKRVE